MAARRSRARRNDERVRHVQRAGDELLAPAARHGARRHAPADFREEASKTHAPWVAILACAIGWGFCLGLNFERLITIDILLYGTSLMLEFITLIALRIKEPTLRRPFRVPGGMLGAAMLGVCPLLLLGFSVVRGETEYVLGMSSLEFGIVLIACGVVAYGVKLLFQADEFSPSPRKNPRTPHKSSRGAALLNHVCAPSPLAFHSRAPMSSLRLPWRATITSSSARARRAASSPRAFSENREVSVLLA